MLESVTPLKRETLQSQVQQKLCDLILQEELAPGKSVTVASIAKALEVSPMSVREATSRLMALGTLTVVSGRSASVHWRSLVGPNFWILSTVIVALVVGSHAMTRQPPSLRVRQV